MSKSSRTFILGVAAGFIAHYTWANMQARKPGPAA